MLDQIKYYNQFGERNKENILNCPEPELWTTDYDVKGRVYQEMKERVKKQEELINDHFNKNVPVLDIGCGFGRQAFMLARQGYRVTGTDTSDVFIGIARDLFRKNGFPGEFICTDIARDNLITDTYDQILLLDVLEHVKPFERKTFLAKLYNIARQGAKLIISLPHVKKRITSQLNNLARRKVTQHITYFAKREEHPYPIPEKQTIIKLAESFFHLNSFVGTPETDYYVFQRS